MVTRPFYSEFYPNAGTAGVRGTTTPALTEGRVNEIIGDIDIAIEDTILTRDEKIRILIPTDQELKTMYDSLKLQAIDLTISTATVDAAYLAWNTYRDSLVPEWNDTSQNTEIIRDTFRQKINTYIQELTNLQKAVTLEAARRADVDGGLTDNGAPIVREDVITEEGIAAGIEGQGTGATANDLESLNPDDWQQLQDATDKAGEAWQRAGLSQGTQFPLTAEDGDTFYRTDQKILYAWNATTNNWENILQAINNIDNYPVDIRPMERVETLPISGNFDGRLVYFIPEKQMYTYNGSTNIWEKPGLSEVGPNDFVEGFQPLGVGTVLPVLPDVKYPSGSLFVNTTNGKTYTNKDGVWSSTISASDIDGAVPSGIPFGPENPATGGFDTLFLNTTDGKLYRWNEPGGWTTAADGADIIAGSIIGNRLAVGTIQAAQIGARQITASKVAITASNINPDPGFLDDAFWGWDGNFNAWYPETGGTAGISNGFFGKYYAIWSGHGAITSTIERYGQIMPAGSVKPGMVLKLRARIHNGTNRLVMAIMHFYDKDGAYIGQVHAEAPAESGLAERESVATTVPANTVTCRFVMYAPEGPALSGLAIIGPIYVNEMATGQLIVDGTIKANHMSADSVTAGAIQAGAISSDKIQANNILAKHLAIGSFDNIIPDGDYRDITFWNTGGASGGDYLEDRNGAWTSTRSFVIKQGSTTRDITSQYFPIETNASYKVTFRVYTSEMNGDWSFTPYIHVPNYQWQSWKLSAAAGQATGGSGGHGGGGVGDPSTYGGATDTGDVSYTFYNPAGVANNSNRQVQFRFIIGPGTGRAIVQVKMVRISDGSLIVNGGIQANHMAANSVVTNALAAGSVVADKIATNSITARMLTLTDLSNLVPNGDMKSMDISDLWLFENINQSNLSMVTSTDSFSGSNYMRMTKASTSFSARIITPPNRRIPVVPGEQYYGEITVKTPTAGGSPLGCYYRLVFYNAAGTLIGGPDIATNRPIPDTWTTYSGTVTVPTGAVSMGIYPFSHSTATVTEMRIGSMTLRKKNAAQLIVDGSIVANHLAADSVTANKISVVSLAAINANLGAINAGSLNINNRFIVGADGATTIRSGTTGQRVEIDQNGGRVYDASNRLRVRWGMW